MPHFLRREVVPEGVAEVRVMEGVVTVSPVVVDEETDVQIESARSAEKPLQEEGVSKYGTLY
jgi:hypothetical protein